MKILIFAKNWLGDILFEVPAIQALREHFPHARLVVLAPPRCKEILEGVPFLDEIHSFDEKGEDRSFFAKIRLIFWLRRQRFDKVFLFHRSCTRAFLTWLGGIRERIGYTTPKREWLLTTPVLPPARPMHEVDYFLVLLKWAGVKVKFGAPYQFFYRSREERGAQGILQETRLSPKGFVAFHVGANWEPKRWPAAHFARLADLVSQAFSCPIVLTGSARDEKIAQEIIQRTRVARPLSFCGKTSLGVLGALFQFAAFVVSSDSGPLHIASGVGTPVVALFGPTSPQRTGPRGTGKTIVIQWIPPGYSVPWRGRMFPKGGWMERISPEEVFKKIQQENLCPEKKGEIFSLSR